jgi:hypothetical protein
MVPLKGQYATGSKELIVGGSIDSTWAHIDRLFATNGLPIKKIDKNTGTIITQKTSFNSLYTFENEAGQLQDTLAWIVLRKTFVGKKQWVPKSIFSQWQLQLANQGNNMTSIKIDSTVLCTYYPNPFVKVETRGQSTLKLEELIRSSLTGLNK